MRSMFRFSAERGKLSFVSHFSRRLPEPTPVFGDRDREREPWRRCLIGERLRFLAAKLERKGDEDRLRRVLEIYENN
jgi:hypothetical protein